MRCMRFEWKRFSIQVPILVPGSIRTGSALKAHKKSQVLSLLSKVSYNEATNSLGHPLAV